MQEIVVRQNQIDYIGAYSAPAFDLWGEGKSLLKGLYDAFSTYNVTLSDIRIEGNAEDPATQSVRIFVGNKIVFRFKFDRLEISISDFDDSDLDRLVGVMTSGAQWLRDAVPEFRFQSHLVGYAAHASLPGSSSPEFLKSLQVPSLKALGRSWGSGIIFHGEMPEMNRRVQLTLDGSLAVEDGLFLNLIVLVAADEFDYISERARVRSLYEQALAEIGLTLTTED